MMPELEKGNQEFLQAAMQWLHAVLETRAAAPIPPEHQSNWLWRKPAASPQESKSVQKARTAMDDVAAKNPNLPLTVLARRFGLSSFERDVLLLTASAEIDTGLPPLMANATGAAPAAAGKDHPTFALAMAVFPDPGWDALSPERPLRAHRLIEVHQAGAASLLAAPLRIDERIAAYIKGLDYLDERLVPFLTLLADPGALPPSQEEIAEDLHRWLAAEDSRGLLQLTGTHASAKSDVAGRAAALAGRRAFAVHADSLPAGDDLATFLRLWSREALLEPLVLFVQAFEGVAPLAGEETKPAVHQRSPRELSRIAGPCMLDVRTPLPELDAAPMVAVSPPTDLERRALWRDALAVEGHPSDEATVMRLAGEFKSSASQLAGTAGRAREWAQHQGGDAAGHAWADRVQHAGAALAGVTRWVEPRATLEDLKLPPIERQQLDRLIAHARLRSIVQSEFGFSERSTRGMGLTALFHGESGTGKTLAAEVVANALGLGLAVADLSTLKSKYISESEKNLGRIFDAAEEGGAVLCFDEADTLFGKRSEVKDSHDRYANLETNYLLCILTTNQKHALDPAFMRRLRFVVAFPFPGVAERKAIWETVFPAQTPVGKLDYDRLARFQLSGGSIFNAAFAAAHAVAADTAADPDRRVELADLLDAIRWELLKLERPVGASEFRELSATRARKVEAIA
jgi:ATPase family associated with various cellular activities (AAA)